MIFLRENSFDQNNRADRIRYIMILDMYADHIFIEQRQVSYKISRPF